MSGPGAAADGGFVAREAIALDEPVADRQACVERLVDLLARTGRVRDREATVRAVLDREAEAPTGVGEGVAVPHARTDGVDAPALSFLRTEGTVDFGGPQEADLVFLLAVPDGADPLHLDALSRLARGLLDGTVRERLRTAEDPAAAAEILREVVA